MRILLLVFLRSNVGENLTETWQRSRQRRSYKRNQRKSAHLPNVATNQEIQRTSLLVLCGATMLQNVPFLDTVFRQVHFTINYILDKWVFHCSSEIWKITK